MVSFLKRIIGFQKNNYYVVGIEYRLLLSGKLFNGGTLGPNDPPNNAYPKITIF